MASNPSASHSSGPTRRALRLLAVGVLRPFAARFVEKTRREQAELQEEVDLLEEHLAGLQASVEALRAQVMEDDQ